ncbi:MAG: hypothetical protein IKM59_02855, partial [Oscillospiraceae bacterium]|nr:hypothetical protein [Oscillospiraceae bacterium]
MNFWKFAKSLLALLLVFASLMTSFPLSLAAEDSDRQSVTLTEEDLVSMYEADQAEASSDDENVDDFYTSLDALDALIEDPVEYEYGNPEFPCLTDEQEPNTRGDNLNTSYVFMDFKIGSNSRKFNWQYKSSGSTDIQFHDNPGGYISGWFGGGDPRLYMPIDLTDTGKARCGGYVLKKGDIVQVRFQVSKGNGFTDTEPTGGYAKYRTYFALLTSESTLKPETLNDNWAPCNTITMTSKAETKILTFDATSTTPDKTIGKVLYGVRWDPLQPPSGTTYFDGTHRFNLDYIYVGPASTAPVSVVFRTEGDKANMSYETVTTNSKGEQTTNQRSSFNYVGYGQYAPAFSTGKTNSESGSTQTIWGWTIKEDPEGDGSYVDAHKFVTDPTTHKVTVNTRFVLTSVTIRKETLRSYQEPDNGVSTEDDDYKITVDCFDTAEVDIGKVSTPLDITLVVDRSASQAQLIESEMVEVASPDALTNALKNLDTSKPAGYYRASCWRKDNNKGNTADKGWAYVFYMPMRYYGGNWQMQTIEKGCACQNKFQDFGVHSYDKNMGMKQCPHVKWVSMSAGYQNYVDLMTAQSSSYKISTYKFRIGPCGLGRLQLAMQAFMEKLFNSSTHLAPGKKHRVAVVGFGSTVFIPGYPCADMDGGFYKDEDGTKNVDCSHVLTSLDGGTYEGILKKLMMTYVIGATRTDAAFRLLSNERSLIEKAVGYNNTTRKQTLYRKDAEGNTISYVSGKNNTTRNRVIVLLTDGEPTSNTTFDNEIATDAILASKELKAGTNTTVYAVGAMDNLTPTNYYSSSASKINNFMNLISSRYPLAEAYNVEGAEKVTGDYFMADTKSGENLVTILNSVYNNTMPSLTNSEKGGLASLWLYEHFSREWKPDSKAPIKIWAAPYTKNGTYGEKVLIGEHWVKSGAVADSFDGNGYKLHIEPYADQSYACVLQWTDSKSAFLRESAMNTGSEARAMSGSLDLSYGYKIFMEMPITVDRNNTLGGNNIPLITNDSGCYKAKDIDDSGKGDYLYLYDIPDANVFCSVGAEAHDYFVSMEEYVSIVNNKDESL